MRIHSVETELLHADRQIMMKLIVTFHNFVNSPKKCTPRMVYKKLPKRAIYYRKVSLLKTVSTEIDYYTEVEHAHSQPAVATSGASEAIL
jgi:hypothetical protein